MSRRRYFCFGSKNQPGDPELSGIHFFGLSMRQFLFSLLACGVAVGLYFLLRPYMGTETVSWMCVLGAVPFAALGFVRYHGMNAEQFVWAFIKSEVLVSKRLVFHPENLYYEILKAGIENFGFMRLSCHSIKIY